MLVLGQVARRGIKMTLIALLIFLIIIGVLLYLINQLIPMDANIKMIINVVVILVVLLWLLQVFGLLGSINIRIPQAG